MLLSSFGVRFYAAPFAGGFGPGDVLPSHDPDSHA